MQSWQRNQWVATAMVFVVFTGFAFVLPFLPLYVRQLGIEDERLVALWAGVLIGVAPLLAGLLAPVWGRLGDRYGQKPMALRALASYVFLLVLSGAVSNVWQLFLLRVGVGLFGGIGPLGLAMATSLSPREQTGRAVGMIQAAQILAAAVGPYVGGALADSIGVRATFVVAGLFCAGTLLFVAVGYQEAPPTAAKAANDGFAAILRLPHVAALLVVLFIVNFIGRSFTPILPQYLQLLGVPRDRLASSTGLLISLYSVAAALSATTLGKATPHHLLRSMLVVTLVGGGGLVLPMGRVGSFSGMLTLGVLLGLVAGGSLTLCYTMGGLLVPADRRTTAFGFFSGAALFGGSVSPAFAGWLARWDLRAIFYADTALYVLLAAALLPGVLRGVAPEAAARAEDLT
jgi:DHA1 family multidrug resistance protein-like MFS transporter